MIVIIINTNSVTDIDSDIDNVTSTDINIIGTIVIVIVKLLLLIVILLLPYLLTEYLCAYCYDWVFMYLLLIFYVLTDV